VFWHNGGMCCDIESENTITCRGSGCALPFIAGLISLAVDSVECHYQSAALSLRRGRWLLGVQRREVLHQQPVDEDVTAADLAEEDALGAVVEERDKAQGRELFR
jgi:hypothetical protein